MTRATSHCIWKTWLLPSALYQQQAMHSPWLHLLARPGVEGSAGTAEATEFLSGLFVICLPGDSWLPAESQKTLGGPVKWWSVWALVFPDHGVFISVFEFLNEWGRVECPSPFPLELFIILPPKEVPLAREEPGCSGVSLRPSRAQRVGTVGSQVHGRGGRRERLRKGTPNLGTSHSSFQSGAMPSACPSLWLPLPYLLQTWRPLPP